MADYHVPGEHVYNGMVMPGVFPSEVLEKIPSFNFRSDDVLLVTYPKAGTTWLQEIIWLIMNNADVEATKNIRLNHRAPFMEIVSGNYHGFNLLPDLKSPRLIKTHLPYSFFKESAENPEKPKYRTIVGMRNVRDVLVSFYHFYCMNAVYGNFDRNFEAFFSMFKQRRLAYGDYFEHVLSWWQNKDNPNFLFVKYEDMKKDPKREFLKICQFLGRSLTEEQLNAILKETSFSSMQTNPMTNGEGNPDLKMHISKFIRKGEVGDWRNYFTADQLKFVDERCKQELESVGLQFSYTI